ncbi:ATP-dependent DNA helicase RecG [Enteractinococcus fodinae]|uniref:Probable DNA 3'-5' helicase RecG n=1 Tax=Enteractinococcus fodinae TaxID=684663 RepID=A0ABU2AZW0_9MICC|nr:ATP-dependent DNA helicase RecG [Enteractinococcus fodinae]MDR7346889.1 ATP-dependent DNA helicase RecG [Enteractinococcus fodinae]
MDPFNQPLEPLLGTKTANSLAKHLHITTTGQALNYFPRRYIERGELTPITQLPVGEQVTVIARVQKAKRRAMQARRGFLVDVIVSDEATDTGLPGILKMAFFNGYAADQQLTPGTLAMFHGKTSTYRGELTLTNPDFVVLHEEHELAETDIKPTPVYPAKSKLPSWTIREAIEIVLDAINWSAINDPVPQDFLAGLSQNMPTLALAYEHIHRPQDLQQARAARRRFAAQEALILQTLLARRRLRNRNTVPATPYPLLDDGILAHLDAQLPFELTTGQRQAGAEIAAELDSVHPMSRLLQGEVGSGKTLVALRAMVQVVDADAQAVLVAPTEVLASQHYRSITKTLGDLATAGQLTSWQGPATEVVLLTGSMTNGQKQEALLKITTGQAGIIIATHAIFSDNVHFANLGLVVIDEQHRFGVDQREALRQANPGVHMLVMTATPIPRSVAMTVFGDLDVTVLEGLPSGRKPVTTYLARMAHGPRIIQRVWEIIAEEIAAGHQAFVVCPKIDPSDTAEDTGDLTSDIHAANVGEITATIQNLPIFANATVESLHGRQDQQTQDEIMGEFVAGKIDILVATTIIEVGVDIPNATVMAILDPEYFGLSTLHQLRGRVGRGEAPARCFLATRLPDGHPSLDRLAVIENTEDGFEIAKADVEQRGEGDVLGASQHGYASQLQVLKVIQHAELITQAATWVDLTLRNDPELSAYPQLVHAVEAWETAHEDSSDYLEKN